MRRIISITLITVLITTLLAACGSGDVSGISGTYYAEYDENNPHQVVMLIGATITFDGAGGVVFTDSKQKLTGTYKQTSDGYKITFTEIEAAAVLADGLAGLSQHKEQTMTVRVQTDGSIILIPDTAAIKFDEAKFVKKGGNSAAIESDHNSLVSSDTDDKYEKWLITFDNLDDQFTNPEIILFLKRLLENGDEVMIDSNETLWVNGDQIIDPDKDSASNDMATETDDPSNLLLLPRVAEANNFETKVINALEGQERIQSKLKAYYIKYTNDGSAEAEERIKIYPGLKSHDFYILDGYISPREEKELAGYIALTDYTKDDLLLDNELSGYTEGEYNGVQQIPTSEETPATTEQIRYPIPEDNQFYGRFDESDNPWMDADGNNGKKR